MSTNVTPFRPKAAVGSEQILLPPIPQRPFDTKLLRSAVSLLRVGACAFAEGSTPFFTDTTLKDVLEVVCEARARIAQWRDTFDCDASGDIDNAAGVLNIIEAALNAGLSPNKCKFQSSISAALDLLERGRRREVRARRRQAREPVS